MILTSIRKTLTRKAPNAKTGNKGTSHGTHVSGTIAGQAKNNSDVVQKGVAYESDLYVYKVLGYDAKTQKASGSSAQVIDGIEHAVKDGMNVINLSLGSDDEKDPYSPDALAVNNAVLAGVVDCRGKWQQCPRSSEQYYYSMGSPGYQPACHLCRGRLTATAAITPRPYPEPCMPAAKPFRAACTI